MQMYPLLVKFSIRHSITQTHWKDLVQAGRQFSVFIFAVQWAGLLISRPLAVRTLSVNAKTALKL